MEYNEKTKVFWFLSTRHRENISGFLTVNFVTTRFGGFAAFYLVCGFARKLTLVHT
jgi:hypothetical protein